MPGLEFERAPIGEEVRMPRFEVRMEAYYGDYGGKVEAKMVDAETPIDAGEKMLLRARSKAGKSRFLGGQGAYTYFDGATIQVWQGGEILVEISFPDSLIEPESERRVLKWKWTRVGRSLWR